MATERGGKSGQTPPARGYSAAVAAESAVSSRVSLTSAPVRSAPSKLAPFRLAPRKSALQRLAPFKAAFIRFAGQRRPGVSLIGTGGGNQRHRFAHPRPILELLGGGPDFGGHVVHLGHIQMIIHASGCPEYFIGSGDILDQAMIRRRPKGVRQKHTQLPAIAGIDGPRYINAERGVVEGAEFALNDAAARLDELIVERRDGQHVGGPVLADHGLGRPFRRNLQNLNGTAGGRDKYGAAFHFK